jgi:hypothetical protein
MSLPKSQNIQIRRGTTFEFPLRWESEPLVYKAITGMEQSAPCRLTVEDHDMPDGWRAAVVCAKGMVDLNAKSNPPKDSDYHVFTVVDDDTLEINGKSCACFKPYTSGGYIQYYTPHDLSGYAARMSIKDKVGGTELMSLTTENSRISVDDVGKIITLTISADDTEVIEFSKGVYDLELVSPTGIVTTLLAGAVSVTSEVTT